MFCARYFLVMILLQHLFSWLETSKILTTLEYLRGMCLSGLTTTATSQKKMNGCAERNWLDWLLNRDDTNSTNVSYDRADDNFVCYVYKHVH
jgi:hypothetical protein